jgi:hypothetical protein
MLTETEYHEKALKYKLVNKSRIFTWIETLTIAFPMKVAPKNTVNGTKKWPHKKPARSNKGFGT